MRCEDVTEEERNKRYLNKQQQYLSKLQSRRIIKSRSNSTEKFFLFSWKYWLILVILLISGGLMMVVTFESMRTGKGTIGDGIAKLLALIAMELTFCKDLAELIIDDKFQSGWNLLIIKRLFKLLIEFLIAIGLLTWIFMPAKSNKEGLSAFIVHSNNAWKILFPILIQGVILILICAQKEDKIKWLAD